MNNDLISRSRLLKELDDTEIYDRYSVKVLIGAQPTVARPQGEWEEYGEYKLDNHYFKCSACGELEEETSNYCPNCGADMKGKENEQ